MPTAIWPDWRREAALPSPAERQHQFAGALLDPELPVPSGLAGPAGSVRAERFAVYRNNVAVGLIEALRAGFPVVNRLVGDDFFGAMARLHAMRCPPSSPVLLAYGGDFPAFIAEFEPAAALPYLADVARFEWLWLEAYHAAEAEPLTIVDLQRVPPDRLPGLRLTLHPSARFTELAYPVLAVWQAHQGDAEPAPIELGEGPEPVLLVRPQANVEAIALSPCALGFLHAVHAGGTIADAVEAAMAMEPEPEVGEMLSLLFDAGAFSGFIDAQNSNSPETLL